MCVCMYKCTYVCSMSGGQCISLGCHISGTIHLGLCCVVLCCVVKGSLFGLELTEWTRLVDQQAPWTTVPASS